MMTVPLAVLSRYGRGDGFVKAALAAGRSDAFALWIEKDVFERLLREFPQQPAPVLAQPSKWRGLGDVVFWLASRLPAKWKLKNCRCEARRAWLNRVFPFQ